MDGDKNRFVDNNSNPDESYRRDSISSPCFDDNTSNSTLSAASPDPAYSLTYNSNGSRHQTQTLTTNFNRVESWAEKHHSTNNLKPKPRLTPKIEGHLAAYETKTNDEQQDERNANVDKIDLPKIDISSRRELFEKEKAAHDAAATIKKPIIRIESETTASIKERLSQMEKRNEEIKEATTNKLNRISGDFTGARERFANNENEQFVVIEPKAPKIDVPVVPLKERLMHLESSMTDQPKLENRARKLSEAKSIGSDQLKDDEDSGINSDDLQSSLASQQSQQQLIDEIKMEPVPAARKPEVAPRRQITPDLVKTTVPLIIDDDLLQSPDEIDDEADNSVSVPTEATALTKNFVNLTIKSVLVDSNDILKTANTPTTSTSMVMENASLSVTTDNDHILDTELVTVVDMVEPILTDITEMIVTEEIAVEQCSAELASNNQIDQKPQSINETILIEKESVDAPHESIQTKNERIKCQIVGVLEKNKIITPTSTPSPIKKSLDLSPTPSKSSMKSPCKSPSKTKHIFDFIKRNLLNETADQEPPINQSDQDSKFYAPLSESTPKKTMANDPNEINQLLDEELDKLSDQN